MHSPITQLEQLTINSKSKSFLKEIVKWCYFLSIVGFIGIGFFILVGIFAGSIYGSILNTLPDNYPFDMSIFMTVTYLAMAAIYFFPVLYLFKFSKRLKVALSTKNDETLANALEMLKSHYKFIGVFMIIMLSLYGLILIISLLGFAFA